MESKTIFPLLQIENAVECRIIRRANRFVVAISVNGNEYRACINNTGRLTEFLVSGTKGFCILR
jgi:sugar fermentation stimulation protein A